MSSRHPIAPATEPSARLRLARSRPTPGPGAPPMAAHPAGPIPSRILKDVGLFTALAAVYFVAGKLGLPPSFLQFRAPPSMPPTAVALGGYISLGSPALSSVFA